MSYPIFPSLSRSPDFSTTRKIEDGTIKDPMESGYVSTRPRFTRLRRTFGVGWKNLTAQDVQSLDKFETKTVQGGAGAFYLPNLLTNASFEKYEQQVYSTPSGGWSKQIAAPQELSLALSATSAVFTSVSGYSLAASNPHLGQNFIQAVNPATLAGNIVTFSGYVAINRGTLPSGVTLTAQAFATFIDATGKTIGSQIFANPLTANTSGQDYSASFMAPAGCAASYVGFYVFLENTTASAVVLDGSVSVTVSGFQGTAVSGVTFDGWSYQDGGAELAVSVGLTTVEDGSAAVQFQSVPQYSLAANNPNLGYAIVQLPVPCAGGDTVQFSANVSISLGTLPSGVTLNAQAFFTFADAAGNTIWPQIFGAALSASTSGFQFYAAQQVAPVGAASVYVGFYVFLHNGTASAVVLDGSTVVVLDECGLAVVSAAKPFGRMPGNASPANAVRFSKPLTIRDAVSKFADGAPRYDASCEVTEL